MRMSDFVVREAIIPDLTASSKDAVIRAMATQRFSLLFALALVMGGCGTSSPAVDAATPHDGGHDAGTDAGPIDSGPPGEGCAPTFSGWAFDGESGATLTTASFSFTVDSQPITLAGFAYGGWRTDVCSR